MKLSDYNKEKISDLVGEIFDYAVNFCEIDGDKFWNLLILSGYSKYFENGNPKYVLGKTSTELVLEILAKTGYKDFCVKDYEVFNKSCEYWAGWALSQYQIERKTSYKTIHNIISFNSITDMYYPLHEAPVEKFINIVDKLNSAKAIGLKTQRETAGLSQSQLSKESGINIKSIQAYEQGLKNIKNAKASTLKILATVLSCDFEDLL